MARARPELSKKRIKIGFPCAQILDIPLFEFYSKVCTRFSAEKNGHFTENYAENLVLKYSILRQVEYLIFAHMEIRFLFVLWKALAEPET